MSAERGVALIAILCTLCGALVAWNVTAIAAELKARKAADIAAGNLAQAEACVVACLHDGVCIFGTAIYRCRTEKSELTTADFPELAPRGRAGNEWP